jgi:hypothetical protein
MHLQARTDWARGKACTAGGARCGPTVSTTLRPGFEDAPVTRAWISETIGLQPHGLVKAESWWESFSRETEPALPAQAILADRAAVADQLRQALSGGGQLMTIAGSGRAVAA